MATPTQKMLRFAVLLAIAGSATLAPRLQAQSSDALIDKLVEKGILNVNEANQLREESDKDFNKAYSAKNGMPEWVTALKINGDFRGRVEHFNADDSLFTSRTRFRYRARIGITATLAEDFEVGVRLTSADVSNGLGGNPISANSTLQNGATRKAVYFDTAYAKWNPIHNGTWNTMLTLGKMDSQFQVSPMVFDADYQPEGAQAQIAYTINDQHTVRAIGAYFALNELNQINVPTVVSPSHDPALLGGQMLFESKWSKKLESTFGIGVFALGSKDNLDNAATLPNVNDGNTRNGAGQLVNNYNPVVASGSVVYKLDSFPMYDGAFPVKLAGEYMDNPGAPTQNIGYNAGITLGKSGEKGKWELSYRYQMLGADAWYEEVVDDDNGAFYQKALGGSGFSNAVGGFGYRGGTNVKGHLVVMRYSITDSLTFVFTYYLNSLVQPNPAGSTSTAAHFMADLSWKF